MGKRVPSFALLALLCGAATAWSQDTTLYYTMIVYQDSASQLAYQSKVSMIASAYIPYVNATPTRFGYTGPFLARPTIGDPMNVCVVSAERIATDSALSVNDLGTTFNFRRAPVYRGSELGSSIDIDPGLTRSYMFGYPHVTRAAIALRDSLALAEGVPKNVYYLVDIPAINLLFLGRNRKQDGRRVLTPVFRYPRYSLNQGESLSADAVWSRLIAGMGAFPASVNSRIGR